MILARRGRYRLSQGRWISYRWSLGVAFEWTPRWTRRSWDAVLYVGPWWIRLTRWPTEAP